MQAPYLTLVGERSWTVSRNYLWVAVRVVATELTIGSTIDTTYFTEHEDISFRGQGQSAAPLRFDVTVILAGQSS